MKNLLLSISFIAAAFITQAQDGKPTKEETQRFLNSMLAKVVGEIIPEGYVIKKQSFVPSFDSYESLLVNEDNSWSETYSLIKWENFIQFEQHVNGNTKLRFIRLYFNSKLTNEWNIGDSEKPKTRYSNSIQCFVPADKYESVEKACLRLAEIAKEENKDPFEK